MDTTRIYIVEDEALIVMELVDRLTRLGYQVCGKAARGEQALEDIPRANPDIVLMDICLAGELNGIETAARLRRLLNVPIVFLSAFSDAKLVEEAIGSGAFGYLLKPFEERELHATLQAALAKHRLERALQEANATLEATVLARTAALTQSEAQLRDLFDGTSDLIQSVAPDGRLLFVNRAWRETLGYSADEVAAMNIFDVIQADCRDHCRSFMQRIIAGEDAGLVEISFRAKDDRVVVAEGQVSLSIEGSRPVATRGIFRDITARKAAEEKILALNKNLEQLVTERTGELRESEERLRTLFEQAAVGVAEIDTTTGRFIRINRKYGEILGYSVEEMLALDFMTITHPDDLASDLAQMERLTRGELREFTLEKRYIRKDGAIVWVELTVSPLWAGSKALTRHIAVVKDITERKQVESQLRLTQFAVEHAADAVLWADDTKRFVYVNEAACRSLGYTREELLTLRIPDIAPQHDPERFQQRLTSIQQGRSATYESLHRRKDGTEFPVEAAIAYLEHEGRGYTCGIVRDITERKQAEQALAEKTNELSDFIEHATVSMHWVGPDGIILWANQTELDLLGYTREEYIGHHIAEFHVDQPTIQRILRHLSCGEAVQEYAARLRSKDGSIKDVLIDSSVLWKNGTFIHTRCFTRDITERKRTEAALQFLSSGIVHLRDEAFFSEMAVQVAKLLNLEIGFVGKILTGQPPRIRAVGLSIDGQALPPVEYDLAGTPCERVIGKQAAIFPEQVQQLFPEDRMLVDLGISSYAGVPLFDMNGRPIGHVGVMSRRPLRQVKQVEDLLRLFAVPAAAELERQRTETKFHDLFEFSPDAVVMVNPEGLITLANRQAQSLFGYSREELLGLPVEKLMPEAGRQGHAQLRQQFLAAAMPRMMGTGRPELHATKKDGTIFPIDISLSPIQSEEGLLVAAAVRDITARKQAEQALQNSERYNRQLFELSPLGLALCRLDGSLVDINDAYARILGRSKDETLRLTYWEITPEKYAVQEQTQLESLQTTGRYGPYEKEYLHKDGHLVPVRLSGVIVEQEGEQFIWSTVEDITQHKQAEQALQAFQDQIRQMQKMEAIGQLAGGVAHDFNNILTAILGNAEIVCAKIAADHPAQPNLTRIVEAGTRASHLVQQILTFTHQQEFSRTALDLAPVLHEALALLRATLPAGIKLTTTCEAATPPILADATQIHQVVMNLCTNAWHALNEQPGQIAVDLAPITLTQPLHSFQTALPPGFYVRLSIRDTGCGMEPETVERIFDPFFTTKPVGQGTGLGLSVVHGIVRGHEGAIVVDSHPGQGTTFHLYFHAAETAAPAHESGRAMPVQPQGRNRHLLYLDDEEMLVELIRAKFEPLGYRVTGYTKPTEALDAVRADPSRFDVVVTDYNMPGLSGLDVAIALSQLRADLPVVVVSGYLSPTAQAAILTAGIKEIVYKPTLLQQLGEVVARLTGTTPPR